MSRVLAMVVLSLAASVAHAQEITPLSGGWSMHRSVGISGTVGNVACARDRAFVREWSGNVAAWDGASWSVLPRRTESMYGRTIAASPDGHVFLEAGSSLARWDGHAWSDHPLEGWEGDLGAQIVAISASEVYYVGRGRIARFDGTRATTYSAGTWRSLSALASVDGQLWVGGQGGTILRRDAGWAREHTELEAWIRSLVAFAPDDVWAIAGQEHANDSVVLHYDGRAWTGRDYQGDGRIEQIGGTADRVYATNPRAGLLRWDGSAWVTELAQSELGADGNYYGTQGVCATDHHYVVGFGPHALVRAR